jgi:hypothetical protein
MSQLPLFTCIFLLIGSALAADVPFVFDEATSDVAGYTADRIEEISASSSDLVPVYPRRLHLLMMRFGIPNYELFKSL